MKRNPPALLRNYLGALRNHLKKGSAKSSPEARKLGLQAVKLGLETLDLAKIHEEALITLVLPKYPARASEGMIRRAGVFFAEAITPIEETHRGALEANVHLKQTVDALTQRTSELAASNRNLKRAIARCLAVEKSLRTSELSARKHLEKSRRMEGDLRLLSRRLLSVQEEERKRISRDLHDVVSQTLTGINFRLAAIKTLTTSNTKVLSKKIALTQKLVEKSVAIVHRFARDLRPTVLDDLGLIPALHAYLKTFMERTGIRVSFASFAGIEKLGSAKRAALFRVAQEALINTSRHAKATEARVQIREHEGGVHMEVHDNGRGFQVEGALPAKSRKRLGLLGMRERVEMVGGAFRVESTPGQGTTVRVDLPHGQTRDRLRKSSNRK